MEDLEVQGQQCFMDLGDSSLTDIHSSQPHAVDTHGHEHTYVMDKVGQRQRQPASLHRLVPI